MWFEKMNVWLSLKAFLFSLPIKGLLFSRERAPDSQLASDVKADIPAPLLVKVNFYKPEMDRIVLVEEENLIRWKWEKVANESGLPLTTYAGCEEFLWDISQFTERTKFFLDQDMYGERQVGLKIARALRANPATKKAYICLVTGYSPSDFRDEIQAGVISDVRGKFPYPFRAFTAEDMVDFLDEGFVLNFASQPRRAVKRSSAALTSTGEIEVIDSAADLPRAVVLKPRHARIRSFEASNFEQTRQANLNQAIQSMQLRVRELLDSVPGPGL